MSALVFDWTTFANRLVRALRLEPAVYEELEADRRATPQAAVVVVLSVVAFGVGSGIRFGLVGFVITVLIALASWSFYAWIVYFLGTTILKGKETKTDWGEIARTVGFATAPNLLLIFRAIADIEVLVTFGVALWRILATVVAVRAAVDVSTARAAVIAILAIVLQVILTGILLWLQNL